MKKLVLKVWPNAKVYLFGSSVKGKYTASSDIDILIVVDNASYEEASKFKAQIYMELDYPLEIHVATPKQFTNRYIRFIKEDGILEI